MSTILWSALDLSEATGGAFGTIFGASGISIDTRTLVPGDLFVALVGEGRDGHDFVADAMAKGAAGAMVHRSVPGVSNILLVDDTLAALARLGGFARARYTGRAVAVTGSVGKTTTKEMLRTVLSGFGPTHAAVASYNNHWGLPLTLARTPFGTVYSVAELGMNHAGEIAPLARLARPHVAVITTVERAHIGYLGSLEAIADEKAAIMSGLEPDGVAVLPIDHPLFPRLRDAAGGARILTFGTHPDAAVRLLTAEEDSGGSNILFEVLGREGRMRLNVPGRHMVMNALATLAATTALGLDLATACRHLERFQAIAGRGARRSLTLHDAHGDKSLLLLDESYNGNGASMRAALNVLRLQPARRRVAILGDMLELGDHAASEHVGLAADVAASADVLFACGPHMKLLFDAVPAHLRGAHAPDSATLAPLVAAALASGDAVLVKGSLGSKMKHVVDAIDTLALPRPGAGTDGARNT